MAEEFRIPGLDKVVPKWGQLNKEMAESVELLLAISKEGQKVSSSFKLVDSIKGFETFENKAKASIKGVSTAYKGLNQQQQAQLKAYKDQNSAALNLAAAQKKEAVETEKLKLKRSELLKQSKQQAREELGLVSAYEKVVRKMNQAGKSVQNLNAKRLSGKKLTDSEQKELKQSTLQFRKYQKAVLGADASVGRFQRNVGNYPKALGAVTGAVRSLSSALGLLGGAFLAVSVFGDAFRRIRDFDKELQNISGISGITRKNLKSLEAEILSVAGSSIKTSNEVAQLASTLFTLGKSESEVKKLLKPVNDLSVALGSTSEESADFLGQTLNAFGKGAESGQEFADIIANVRTSTSLDFQRIKDALGFVAPTANALGLTLGQVSAQIGVLQDSGIKAARAGRLLNTSFARLVSQGITLDQALDQINEAQDKVAVSTELFGKESFTLGLILADNVDKTADLANEFDNLSSGSLKKLTDEQLKSLDAQTKILTSSWEELILTIDNGKGTLSTAFSGFIETITFAIQQLTKLEKAQSDVVAAVGEGQSKWRTFFNFIIPGLGGINSEFDDLVEKQKEFNKVNENIDANGIATLESMYQRLQTTISDNNDLSEKETQLYKNQLNVIGDAIERKKEERKSLEETAIALGFNEKELGKYADTIALYTDGDLQKWIAANKDVADSIEDITKATQKARSKTSSFLDLYGLKTAEESKKEFQKEGKKVLDAFKDSFGIDGDDLIDNSGALNEIANFFDNNDFTNAINPPDDTDDKWKDTFTNITNVATQAFGIITALSDASFAKQFANLEAQKENSLKFAGESAEAREEIEKQYDQKRKAIEQKQAIAKKNQAIFEIAINTASAIVQALPNVPLSIAVGALGAIQLGLVASQAIPQFEDGVTDFDGGLAVINDQKGSNYREYVRTPDGKMTKPQGRNLLVDLPKGSDVLSAAESMKFDEDLRRLTSVNNIMFESQLMKSYDYPQKETNQLTKDDLSQVIGRLENTINNSSGYAITYDENGVEKYITKSKAKTKILNNTLNIRGKNV